MNEDIEITRKAFSFYESFESCITDLDEREGFELYRAISRYSLYGENPRFEPDNLSPLARMAWRVIWPVIKAGREKSKNGSKGGNASKVNNPDGINQYEVKQKVKQDKDKDKDKSFKKNKFFSHSLNNGAEAPETGVSEEDFFKEKEKEFIKYWKQCLSDAHKSWRKSEEITHGIRDWDLAMNRFAYFCRGSAIITQINSLEDFQRIFHYKADKFLLNGVY